MTLPDEMLSIDTPENVAFGYNVAGIGSRFLAALVDTTIIVILQVIITMLSLFTARQLDMIDTLGSWLTAILGFLSFILFWGYYIFFEMIWNGQSPGKRWAGLRVIRVDGTPVTLAESIIRNLVRIVDFLPIGYGIGIITMFVNDKARRLGDMAAGSMVVHDGGEISIHSLASHTHLVMPVDLPGLQPGLALERLQPQDIQMMEDFLSRRLEIANTSRLSLQILKHAYTRMGAEMPEDLSRPDGQLYALINAVRNRSGNNENHKNGETL